MTREIKFRYWNGVTNEMVNNPKMPHKEGWTIEQLFSDRGWVWMQFTGLLDRHGKEIYEGDTVEWKYLQTWHKNEVRWVGGGFVVTTSGFKDDLNEPQDLSLVSILNCEIIGNIWEDAHLLEEKK